MDRFWAVAGPSTRAQIHPADSCTFLKCSSMYPPMCRRLDSEPGKGDRRLHFFFIFGAAQAKPRALHRRPADHPASFTQSNTSKMPLFGCPSFARSQKWGSDAVHVGQHTLIRVAAKPANYRRTPLGSSSGRYSRRWTGIMMTIRHPVHRAVRTCARSALVRAAGGGLESS